MFVIVFDRFPIVADWLVSTFIDNDRFLSIIQIIDMLRPVFFNILIFFIIL